MLLKNLKQTKNSIEIKILRCQLFDYIIITKKMRIVNYFLTESHEFSKTALV